MVACANISMVAMDGQFECFVFAVFLYTVVLTPLILWSERLIKSSPLLIQFYTHICRLQITVTR
jgi:hypothetical protein